MIENNYDILIVNLSLIYIVRFLLKAKLDSREVLSKYFGGLTLVFHNTKIR